MGQNYVLLNTMDERGCSLYLILLWLIHLNLDHMPPKIQIIPPPLENDGPHHFMLKRDP